LGIEPAGKITAKSHTERALRVEAQAMAMRMKEVITFMKGNIA
jgi:hypothetical protein